MSMICRSRRVSAWGCGFLFIIPRPFCYVFSRGAINPAHRKSMSTCPESSRICARAGPKHACGTQAPPHKGKDADRIEDATRWDDTKNRVPDPGNPFARNSRPLAESDVHSLGALLFSTCGPGIGQEAGTAR